MQGPDNAQAGPEEDYGDNGVRGGPSHPMFLGGGDGPGAEGADHTEHPQGQRAVPGPLPDGDASAAALITEPMELYLFLGTGWGRAESPQGHRPLGEGEQHLRFPYSYAEDAEIACMYLGPVVRSLPEGIYSEITIDGNHLNILLTSENSHLVEFATAACDLIHLLSMVFLVFEDFET
ncbi:hypothetical protein H920_11329 [Fukomys damarensis]|uniref:Uncharacterized protein n=1 Tax=Fukomys damarensis TaxID=885580 RepID=A0A091DAK8_FUKDA|nr:hypothetical protein H920_11329 [Fukomys damarensis]